MKKNNKENYNNVHWADHSAQQVIDKFPNEKIYSVASGVTPSGIVHVGHFREIITTEFVRKALEKKGKKTKFIYSWDSYDAFRKVPKNIPEEFSKYLRLPNSKVPDPNKKYESFAEFFMSEAEKSLKVFNFPIEFQRQHLLQTSGIYAEGIRKHLRLRNEIRMVLDKYREKPLENSWLPLSVFCEKCNKDTTKILDYDEEYSISYECKCGFKNKINFKETPIVKLPWRLDWPMRWAQYKITFEPGGKDHSTPGGSFDTAKEIIKIVSKREAPVYTFYNFISMKGQGGKISSSSGNGATIDDILKIYTPELVLYLFASTRPNAEFSISFDLDVMKIYEDFDKLERTYFGLEEEKNPKKKATLNRIYELSIINSQKIPTKMPFQPKFRYLLSIAQSHNFEYEKIEEFFKKEIKTDFDKNRLKERINIIKNWLELYAPEDMKFHILEKINKSTLSNLNEIEKEILIEIREKLNKINESKELINIFKEISQKKDIETKIIFQHLYKIIIGKEKGPRLSNLILENKEKVLNLLNQI